MKKQIGLFYVVYTIYMVVICIISTMSLSYIFPGLALMWVSFGLYCLGNKSKRQKLQIDFKKCHLFGITDKNVGQGKLFLLGLTSLIFAILAARYYTGITPIGLLRNYANGVSSYYNYQRYFKENGIAVFSLLKLPFVLMLVFNRILLYYSYILFSISGQIRNRKYWLYLFLVTVAHLYFGLARGTNFEFYQLFTLIAYCYIAYHIKMNKKINYGLLFVMGLIMVLYYTVLLSNRGINRTYYSIITYGVYYDQNSILVKWIPQLASLIVSLFAYLGFGIYYISCMVNEVWLGSLQGIADIFFPLANNSLEPTNIFTNIMVKWTPNMAIYMDKYGLFPALGIVYLLGVAVWYSSLDKRNGCYYEVIQFLAFMFMLSLPVGNFLSFTTEKLVIIYTIFMVLFGTKLRTNIPRLHLGICLRR